MYSIRCANIVSAIVDEYGGEKGDRERERERIRDIPQVLIMTRLSKTYQNR